MLMQRMQTTVRNSTSNSRRKASIFNRKTMTVNEQLSVRSLTAEEKREKARQERKAEQVRIAQAKVKQDLAH